MCIFVEQFHVHNKNVFSSLTSGAVLRFSCRTCFRCFCWFFHLFLTCTARFVAHSFPMIRNVLRSMLASRWAHEHLEKIERPNLYIECIFAASGGAFWWRWCDYCFHRAVKGRCLKRLRSKPSVICRYSSQNTWNGCITEVFIQKYRKPESPSYVIVTLYVRG